MRTRSLSRSWFRVIALVALAYSGASHAQSQSEPGIGGFWMASFGDVPPRREPTPAEAQLLAHLPDDAVLLADSGLVEFDLGDYGGLDIHAPLVEAARNYDPVAAQTIENTCRPQGLTYSMQGPFPIEIFEGRDLIVMKLEYFDLVRIIFMNETEHPADWPHSMTGHSIGRWDGDTLVIDTTHLEVGTLFNNGVDHTRQLHVIERFRVVDGDTLLMTQEFRDPGSFDGTAARILSFDRGDDHVYPYDCSPSYDLMIDSRQGPG